MTTSLDTFFSLPAFVAGVRGVRAQHAESGLSARTRPKPQEHRAVRFGRQPLCALKGEEAFFCLVVAMLLLLLQQWAR